MTPNQRREDRYEDVSVLMFAVILGILGDSKKSERQQFETGWN
jgi:hypothetical protein